MADDDFRDDTDQDRARDLSDYANAGGQPVQPRRPPEGHALVRPTSALADRVIGAQPVAVKRDMVSYFQTIKVLAAQAGDEWYYRFPVKKKEGGVDWIEGPSIQCTNDVARTWGNCIIEVREIDVGDAWTFYVRFTDIETGFSLERSFRQRKSQASMRTKDYDRQLDIAYQIGQSKAIRNCVRNGLQTPTNFAFREAKNSLVNKIGKDVAAWRTRTVEGLGNIPVEVKRVERVIGRVAKDWLAPDVASVIAMMRAIDEGMATLDETFPPLEAEKPTGTVEGSDVAAPDGGGQAASVEGGRNADAREPAPAAEQQQQPAPPSDQAITAAYQRGKDAKAAGASSRAMPGEYRDDKRTREALAYTAGFNGNPIPTFND